MRVGGQLHVPAALCPGKQPLVHIEEEAPTSYITSVIVSCVYWFILCLFNIAISTAGAI